MSTHNLAPKNITKKIKFISKQKEIVSEIHKASNCLYSKGVLDGINIALSILSDQELSWEYRQNTSEKICAEMRDNLGFGPACESVSGKDAAMIGRGL